MRLFSSICALCLLVISNYATAGVVVGATRVVFDANKREAQLSVENPTKSVPYLIQSWVENFNEADTSKAPFTITPPLFRLDAGQENLLRIIPLGGSFPQDRESVYWLNVKSIPSSSQSDRNELQITVKTRIKLFWRPASLSGKDAAEAYKALTFRRDGGKLVVNNPTAYYVSFMNIKVNGQEVKEPGMVSPRSTLTVTAPAGNSVTWQAINDFGGITEAAKASL